MKNHKVLSILILFGVLASGFTQAEVTEKIIEQKRKDYHANLTALDEYRKKQAERYRVADATSKAVILAETRSI